MTCLMLATRISRNYDLAVTLRELLLTTLQFFR